MKKIWITGGGSGIGKELALKLSALGHKVFVSGRNEEKLNALGPTTTAVPCDISIADEVEKAVKQIGTIDLAILNAGTYTPGPAHLASMDDFRQTMEVNYFGTLNCLHQLLPIMKEQGGHIAVVGSIAGYRGLPNASGYGPSKAAVISLCESLRAELMDYPVKFQLINPGFVKSPLTSKNTFEMPYLMEPEDAADEILKGLEKDSFEIAFPTPFVRRMKMLRLLPYKLFFPLIKKVTQS